MRNPPLLYIDIMRQYHGIGCGGGMTYQGFDLILSQLRPDYCGQSGRSALSQARYGAGIGRELALAECPQIWVFLRRVSRRGG
jgi:hypothetical protein